MSDFNIHYVARLARLELTPEEEARLGGQLDNILGYIAMLREVDVTGVEPMSHAFPLTNVSRPDEPGSRCCTTTRCGTRLRVRGGCSWCRRSWSSAEGEKACCID